MTRDADALHAGDRIHITPHDVYAGVDHAIRRTRIDAEVLVAGVVSHGCIIVICWHACGNGCGVVCYDRHDPVKVLDGAA